MDIGFVVALSIASALAFVGGIAAGLFGGMWWQARQTAKVWEKAYTHVREQLNIKVDTYNTGGHVKDRDPRAWGETQAPPTPDVEYVPAAAPRQTVRVPAGTVVGSTQVASTPSAEAHRFDALAAADPDADGEADDEQDWPAPRKKFR